MLVLLLACAPVPDEGLYDIALVTLNGEEVEEVSTDETDADFIDANSVALECTLDINVHWDDATLSKTDDGFSLRTIGAKGHNDFSVAGRDITGTAEQDDIDFGDGCVATTTTEYSGTIESSTEFFILQKAHLQPGSGCEWLFTGACDWDVDWDATLK
jgi:hypothetical protein